LNKPGFPAMDNIPSRFMFKILEVQNYNFVTKKISF